jgi:hypothetical protein
MGGRYEHRRVLFLPLMLPSRFKDSSAVPASYVWMLAAISFLAANFMVWKRERRRTEDAASRLREIENAKPRLMLKQPGAIYSELVTQTFRDETGTVLKQRVDNFLKVRFINDPSLSVPSSKATGVIATIDYHR